MSDFSLSFYALIVRLQQRSFVIYFGKEEMTIKKFYLSISLLIIATSQFLRANTIAQSTNNHKVIATYENWSLRQEEYGLLLIAKGRPMRVTSLNGVENALLAKALHNIYFGAFYQKDKKPRYFIRFSQAFIADYYLEGKTSASWREVGQASFRRGSMSLLQYFEKLQNQLTVWQIEPMFNKKQLPENMQQALKNNADEFKKLSEKYFWEVIFTDWQLRKTSIWLDNIYIGTSDEEKPIPLMQDLLYWIKDGLMINEKQGEIDGYRFNNLYMTTTMTTLDQQPSFTIDFGFKHLPEVLKLLEKYQKN